MPVAGGAASVHKDRTLQRVAVGHVSPFEELTGAAPVVTVTKKSDKYWVYDEDDFRRFLGEEQGPEAPPSRIGQDVTTQDFTCQTKKLETVVSDEERDNADSPLEPDVDAARLLKDAMVLKREVDIGTKISTTTWGGTLDVSSTTQWDAASGSKPLNQMDTGSKTISDRIILDPNVCVMDRNVFRVLRKHADLQPYINASSSPRNTSMALIETLKEIWGFEKIIVARNIRVTSKKGASSTTRVKTFSNMVWMGYVAPQPTKRSPTALATFTWKDIRMGSYREDKHDRDVMKANMSYTVEAPFTAAGYLLTNVLANP